MAERTAVATFSNKSVDQILAQVDVKRSHGLALPEGYSAANALNSAYLILQETVDRGKNPVLQSCSIQSISSALLSMVVQGLDPIKKHCYFIAYDNKLTLIRSYMGTQAVAKRHGLKKIVANPIYKDDEFAYHIDPMTGNKVIDKHIQNFTSIDEAAIIGAYAVAQMMDGDVIVDVMNIKQIEAAWKKGQGYGRSSVHTDFRGEMAKKTVINRLCKTIVNTSNDDFDIQEFNEVSENEYIDMEAEQVTTEIHQNANRVVFDATEVKQVPDKPQQEDEQIAGQMNITDFNPGF